MKNQYAVLGTFAKTRKETHPATAHILVQKRKAISDQMELLEKVGDAEVTSIRDELIGMEGLASRHYWEGIKEIIPSEYGFTERSGRYAKDPVNSMLNYGYALLEGEIWRGVHFAGLDPYGGFLHVDRPGKPSMVLDLMEEFRQQVVDKTVVRLITKNVVDPTSFEVREGMCKMNDASRKKLLSEVIGKFEQYLRYRGVKLRWADLVLTQARNIAKYVRGETGQYEGFYLRW
jgi:CRISPR-associated protein Cas1